MNERGVANSEENVYASVHRILWLGMIASTALFVIGIIAALMHPRPIPLSAEWITSQYHLATILHGLRMLDPTSIMLVATALLIFTPIVRVVASIIAFAIDRDAKFVVVTTIVFLLIVLSAFLGVEGLK